jgi:hypothetical protein
LNGGTFQNANTFTVNAGSYTISVKDVNGCTGISSSLIITQPAAIIATASAAPISCNGGNTNITVLATGGPGNNYEYSLNNGSYQPGNTFNVVAGTYTIDVRSMSNPACSTTVSNTINITQPGILKAVANANAIAFCGGNSTARITATGGTPPYTGTGNFIREPGIWNFMVVDARGCSSSVQLNIRPPGCLNLRVYPNPAQNLITINHSAASTGAAIQIYSINGALVLSKNIAQNAFITTIDVSTLASDVYLVVFTNGQERKEVKFVKTTKK